MNTLVQPLFLRIFRPFSERFGACIAVLALVLGLGACGGGGGASVTTSTSTTTTTTTSTSTTTAVTSTSTLVTTPVSTTSTTGLYLVGIAFPLATNNSVHVPAGTVIAAADGTVTTLNVAKSTVNVPGGSVLTVPATATGPANILITALPSLPYTLAINMPIIAALAGSPTVYGPPTDGVGTAARFWGGGHLALDKVGNLFITDGAALKQVSQTGVVRTLATAYQPYDWEGIAIDTNGKIYGSGTSFAPSPYQYGASIQSIDGFGVLKTEVSNWAVSATETKLGYGGLAVDTSGNLYLTDALNHRILKFNSARVLSVFAGNGATGLVDGTGTAARFNNPTDLAMDDSGNIYVSDTGNSAIRKITPGGVVTTISKQISPGAITSTPAGQVYFIAGSPRSLHRISQDLSYTMSIPLAGVTDGITGLAADSVGNVYAATAGVGAQILRMSFY